MTADAITAYDVENALRAGWVEMSEYENGEWRYRIRTNQIAVIIAFESPAEIVIVTAWRF